MLDFMMLIWRLFKAKHGFFQEPPQLVAAGWFGYYVASKTGAIIEGIAANGDTSMTKNVNIRNN